MGAAPPAALFLNCESEYEEDSPESLSQGGEGQSGLMLNMLHPYIIWV